MADTQNQQAKHTPAPWTADKEDEDEIINISHNYGIIACVYNTDSFPCLEESMDEEATANANLMAAAPELLEACKVAVKYMKRISSDANKYHREMMEPLHAAIAKAEGRSNG